MKCLCKKTYNALDGKRFSGGESYECRHNGKMFDYDTYKVFGNDFSFTFLDWRFFEFFELIPDDETWEDITDSYEM